VKPWGSVLRRYLFATATVAASALGREALSSWLGDTVPFLLFFPAIMAAGWNGGFGPGVWATLLSAAATLWPIGSAALALDFTEPGDDFILLIFVAVGVLISRLNESLRRTPVVASRLAAIVESSDDAIVGKDLNGIVTSWNRAAERLFGYTAAEAIGQSITFIIPNERWSEQERVLTLIRRGHRVEPFETQRRRKDGTLVDVLVTVSPTWNSEGEIIGASKIARDISERLYNQRTLQELLARERTATAEVSAARDRLEFLLEVGELLTSSLDYETTLDRAVHIALPRLGDYCTVLVEDERGQIGLVAWGHIVREKETALHDLAARLVDSASAGGIPTFANDVMRTCKTIVVSHDKLSEVMSSIEHVDAELQRLGDVLRPYAYAGAPLAVRGRAVGVMTFGRSEHESHRDYSAAEVALIEEFARRASLAVENARLFREADELNRLKDEFLATVSHELRTPLSAILGWSRMLASGQLDEDKTRRAVEAIERNAQAQAKLVDDILDVARGMAGNVRLDMATIDLDAVAHKGVDAIMPAAAVKKIQVDVAPGQTPVHVIGDATRLQQVVWNLVSNAVKFTPPGGRVAVAVAPVDGYAELKVADTGTGISRAFLPYVFDKFRQADGSFTRQHGGLGLGLAIARHLVELHGGSIEARSEGEGKGATFVVRLPLAEAAADTQQRQLSRSSPT
jgi:PAS domain S-box-containing protein